LWRDRPGGFPQEVQELIYKKDHFPIFKQFLSAVLKNLWLTQDSESDVDLLLELKEAVFNRGDKL
jgi:hypothetical protein